ncbi:MAG: prepilin-type N-terminal cleavage/methylation domain-containing protein [Pseudomonadota bacterium]|nr:prepilin-type N-terminal cleavage/methylation domain-containing protein [Pseudomonadota bacterium]
MQPTSLLRHQRGFSIVELLIGVALGLFILGGALKLFGDYINNNRQLVLETRVNQDMRAAADLIARDLRRAGYWGDSTAGVTGTALTSEYAAVSPTGTAATTQITYSYSQGEEDNDLDATTENFGFRLNSGALQYLQGGSWQTMTDPNTLTVTAFTVTPRQRCVPLQQYCTGASSSSCSACTLNATTGCPSASCATCPFLNVRSYDIALQGTSTTDSSVVRNLQETVRVRNDQRLGSCP